MSYLSQFPDYDGEFYWPKGWIDNSWHNDVCPRAMYRIENETQTVEFSIWQDYIDVTKREYDNTKRYIFQVHVNNNLIYHYETDNIEVIKEVIKGVQ